MLLGLLHQQNTDQGWLRRRRHKGSENNVDIFHYDQTYVGRLQISAETTWHYLNYTALPKVILMMKYSRIT